MQELEEKVRALIQPIFDRTEFFLLKVEMRGQPNNRVLTIYADTESGITLDEITRLTREIEDVLDMYDPIPGRYRLEVSSPGINWPLSEPWQFRKNIGRTLRVTFWGENEEKKDFTGTLTELRGEEIVLQRPQGPVQIPLNKIIKAVVKLSW
jgi:ribosome maturation factor RimP